MKILFTFSINLFFVITSLAMEQHSPVQTSRSSLDRVAHTAFGNTTLLTLPRDMKKCIVMYLTTAQRGMTDKEKLAVAAKNIRAMAATNKEFHDLISDGATMMRLIRHLELQYNHHMLDVACALGTLASAKAAGELINGELGRKFDGPYVWAEKMIRKNNSSSLRFFLKAVHRKIIDLGWEVEELLYEAVGNPKMTAVILEYPHLQLNREIGSRKMTPLAFAKFLLHELRTWDNEPQREAALEKTIELLKKNGAIV